MKQYRIKIKYEPRSSYDRYPWSWMIMDEDNTGPFGNFKIMAADKEKSHAKAKRNAEKIAKKLSLQAAKADKVKDESYLYPKPSMIMGPR